MPMLTKEAIAEQLKERGLKITRQRLAVIETLIEKKDLHPGAALIWNEARKKKKGLSLSTVYATLDALWQCGIVKVLQFDKMENRYETDPGEHINLVCERCGKILDYPGPMVVDRTDVAGKTGFSITDGRLEYYGRCRECGAAKGNSRRRG